MTDARKADGTGSDAEVLRPRSMEDALERFEAVLDGRRVDAKVRPFFPVWVTRFDAFRIGVLKRSFTTCTNSDVTAFLQDQCRRFSPPLWQLKQAREAVVLFLREVIRLEAIDARLVKLTGGGEVVTGPVEDGPVEDGPVEDGPVEDGPVGGGPGSIEEAINRFVPVMVAARIPFKERAYFVRWVQRLDESRGRVLRRSLGTSRANQGHSCP